MNGHLQVVETNKSLWNEELKSVEPDKYITDMLKSKKSRITAVMSYKKGEHLKLIPFFKPPVSKEPVSDKANGETSSGLLPLILEHKRTAPQFDKTVIKAEDAKPEMGDYTLFHTCTIDLLEKEKVTEILGD